MNPRSATTLCFKPFPLEQALAGVAAAGFDAVELCAVKGFLEHLDPDDLSPAALAHARRALDEHGLRATSLSGHSPLHTADGQSRHRRLLDACTELGIPILNTAPLGIESDDDVDAWIAAARALGEEAERRGVLVCVENDGTAAPTGEVTARLLERVDHPAVRMNYDPANSVFFAGADAEADMAHALGLLGHFHLKDKRGGKDVVDFPPLGEGELDLRELLARVLASGYDGPICLEIEFDGTWPDFDACVGAARRSVAHWDSIAGSAVR